MLESWRMGNTPGKRRYYRRSGSDPDVGDVRAVKTLLSAARNKKQQNSARLGAKSTWLLGQSHGV